MAPNAAMREPTYFLLATLLDGPLHGHGIIKRAEEMSSGRVRLAAGTLYAALDRLTREGLIEPVREETVNGRARQYYALTDSGDAAVHAEADRMTAAARLVTARRAGRSGSAATRPAVKFS
jgi:PadR family transcriptional regulator PadR